MSPNEKTGDRTNERPEPGERRKGVDEGKPLAEEVEKEMEDQDIPVETGIPPSTHERK